MAAIPFNDENKAKIDRLADVLAGTIKNLDDEIKNVFGEEVELDELDIELLRRLDDATMECEGCEWWCETSELDDDQLCGDCRSEE